MSILQRTFVGTLDEGVPESDARAVNRAAAIAVVSGLVALITGVVGLVSLGL